MNVERWEPSLVGDPMVSEARLWDFSWKRVLSDGVLAGYVRNLLRMGKSAEELRKYGEWLNGIFPELKTVKPIPDVWVWGDLVREAENVGLKQEASKMCHKWVNEGRNVAYWTGGLEFTRGHYEVANYLLGKGMKVILGVEPFCYPAEMGKNRGPLVEHSVPVSWWSKLLKSEGFVFVMPRPLPAGEKERNAFYENVFVDVTQREAYIVVSQKDPYKAEKMQRGRVVEVPNFNFPSTTDLWGSYVG